LKIIRKLHDLCKTIASNNGCKDRNLLKEIIKVFAAVAIEGLI
jgi:hypothetical protein